MTNGRETKSRQLYTLTWLPWLLGLIICACYLATVNRSVSFVPDWSDQMQPAPAGVRLAGWMFGTEFFAPVYFLITYPLRWLPEQHIPLALNLFSVLCGALALGQLARSVALLPHDRTRDGTGELPERQSAAQDGE